MDKSLSMCCNRVVDKLQKPPSDFTREDIVSFVKDEGIRQVNFMYPAGDGRLKTLNFIVNDEAYLEEILTCGERVDGSSLFDFVRADSSDLYVVPRFATAFLDPFASLPTVTFLCSFFDKDGAPLDCSPEHTLRKAVRAFHETTGLDFEAMGELEYYVIAPGSPAFPASDQHGYHESTPYAKTNEFRKLCMQAAAQAGARIKYGHSEVGNFTLDGRIYEQNEIEFLPAPGTEAADQLMLAKWIIRNLAFQHGYDVTFAPKITIGKAGSGLHVHIRLLKDGRNQMLQDGALSETARKAIAGMMELAPALTAFGNQNPTSYFRLVPHQEAPTNVCWGDRNRSVLVRVPLGWTSGRDLCSQANPRERPAGLDATGKQTVEIRSPDGSADPYLLLAGLATACRHGLQLENALEIARRTYISVDIHREENAACLAGLACLPDSCAASADRLQEARAVFEKDGVFSPDVLDGIIRRLRSFQDRNLRQDVAGDPKKLLRLVRQHFHCG